MSLFVAAVDNSLRAGFMRDELCSSLCVVSDVLGDVLSLVDAGWAVIVVCRVWQPLFGVGDFVCLMRVCASVEVVRVLELVNNVSASACIFV